MMPVLAVLISAYGIPIWAGCGGFAGLGYWATYTDRTHRPRASGR